MVPQTLPVLFFYENDGRSSEMSIPSTSDFQNVQEYVDSLHGYGNAVASKRQIHSPRHYSTCFKYNKKGTRECRFHFPRPKVEMSHVDELGVAHLRRDDEWVNPYNLWIAAAIRSNQDLSFLATRAKALALLYYITNYATKDEASTYQMVMAAAMMKKTLEEGERASNPTNEETLAFVTTQPLGSILEAKPLHQGQKTRILGRGSQSCSHLYSTLPVPSQR